MHQCESRLERVFPKFSNQYHSAILLRSQQVGNGPRRKESDIRALGVCSNAIVLERRSRHREDFTIIIVFILDLRRFLNGKVFVQAIAPLRIPFHGSMIIHQSADADLLLQ